MIKILKAVYGGLDVKEVIEKNFIHDNIINFNINNQIFTDPMPNVFKKFEIQIEDNEILKEFKLNEWDVFIYPSNAVVKEPPCNCGKKKAEEILMPKIKQKKGRKKIKNIGIVVLATNAYFVLGIRFIKRFMQFYCGDENIKFYFFSDTDPKDYIPDHINCQYTYTTNSNWTDGTNLKFTSILTLDECDSDYLFYFDADTNVNNDFTEEWFLGDMVGGQHYGDLDWMKDNKAFDRNPQSKAYIPLDTQLPQMYYYGAFFGGTKKKMLDFCKTMRYYQLEDKKIPYEPGVNDESYINREFHFVPPTKVVECANFKFAISDKGGIGETRYPNLDVTNLKSELLKNKNNIINIQNNKVIF